MERGSFKYFVTPFRHPLRWGEGSNLDRLRQRAGGRVGESVKVRQQAGCAMPPHADRALIP